MLRKLELKFGKYAISNFMYYIIVINILGVVIGIFAPEAYYEYLSLDIGKILHGQIWRLLTFVLIPRRINFFLIFSLYIDYMIGNMLEKLWGAFRFNLYYLSGLLFSILGTVIIYVMTGYSYSFGLDYINQTLFLTVATLFPQMSFYLYFLVPIKAKYLAIYYIVVIAIDVVSSFQNGLYGIAKAIAIICSMANFLIFFFATRNYKAISPGQIHRKQSFKRKDNEFNGVTRHKCAVCGRTELDDENLEFRFCSKCDGNYEYCMEHLFTHNHVHRN